MAKLGDFKTPTGVTGNIFKINDLASLILGSIVLIFAFAAGQNVANKLNSKVPALDSKMDYPFEKRQEPKQTRGRVVL